MTELFDQLANDLDTTVAEGHLPGSEAGGLPAKSRNNQDSTAFLRTIRTRLITLGYLGEKKKNREHASVDIAFTRAVSRFQRDTGITRDAWVGPVTWHKLQQLTSFEEEQNPDFWQLEANNPAVLRALYLRLYTFGLMQWKRDRLKTTTVVDTNNKALVSAFAKYLDICHQLKLTNSLFETKFNARTLALVFSQDALIEAIDNNPTFYRDEANAVFLTAITRVELWLLGYDIAVGDPGISGPRKLARIIRDFWQDNINSAFRPVRRAHREVITNSLFHQLIHFQQQSPVEADDNEAAVLYEPDEMNEANQLKLQQHLQSIGSSVWDGVKRLLGWLRSITKKLLNVATNFIKNTARLIAQSARQTFKTVKLVIDRIHHGLVHAGNSIYKDSSAKSVIIFHDRDFDHQMIITGKSASVIQQSVLSAYHRSADGFNSACRIMGHLLRVLTIGIHSARAGHFGWFILLKSLARLGSHLKRVTSEVSELMSETVPPQYSLFKS